MRATGDNSLAEWGTYFFFHFGTCRTGARKDLKSFKRKKKQVSHPWPSHLWRGENTERRLNTRQDQRLHGRRDKPLGNLMPRKRAATSDVY